MPATSTRLPLEDNFNDVISKAMRGLKMTASQLADAAGISPAAVNLLHAGEWNEATARKVAPVLNLKTEALVELGKKSWVPEPITLDGLAQFTTPFDDMTVNAYLVWDAASKEAVVFDTGGDVTDILAAIAEKNLRVKFILLTHTHGDHIFDLDRLQTKTAALPFVSDREEIDGAEPFSAGDHFTVGDLRIETRLTWGHSKGGITYVISGLARPLAIVGDAIFAGSMGGGGVSYEDALATNRSEILSLPDDTILAPGHGPLTTVAEEKIHNPFFP